MLAFCEFWMVFIGNPRCGTNMGGGDRIVLRCKPNYLRLLHTWSIMSTKIEVEMVVGPVFIPPFIQRGVSTHPSFAHDIRSDAGRWCTVGNGGDGRGRAREWEVIYYPSVGSQGGEGISIPGVAPCRRAT